MNSSGLSRIYYLLLVPHSSGRWYCGTARQTPPDSPTLFSVSDLGRFDYNSFPIIAKVMSIVYMYSRIWGSYYLNSIIITSLIYLMSDLCICMYPMTTGNVYYLSEYRLLYFFYNLLYFSVFICIQQTHTKTYYLTHIPYKANILSITNIFWEKLQR